MSETKLLDDVIARLRAAADGLSHVASKAQPALAEKAIAQVVGIHEAIRLLTEPSRTCPTCSHLGADDPALAILEQGRREGREEVYARVREGKEWPYVDSYFCAFCGMNAIIGHQPDCLWRLAHAAQTKESAHAEEG